MKWLFVAALIVLALLALGLGLVVAGDPEGRGGRWALLCWSCAVALLIGAGSIAALV